MKGIIIYDDPMWGDNERATYCEFINNAAIELSHYAPKTITSRLEGEASKTSKAVCSKSDTYDFETGALIALMKICDKEKVTKACNELYKDDNYKNALQETTDCLNDLSKRYDEVVKYCDTLRESNKSLQEENKRLEASICAKGNLNNKLLEENSYLNYVKSCNESTINSLENTRDLLKAENEKLKSDKDKTLKIYQRNIQKKQDRINELQAQRDASENDKRKNIEYYEKEIKKLRGFLELYEKENKDLKKNIDELFKSEQHSKSELGRLYFEKHRLEEENEKLKLDCEKLQHGYIDSDMIFCGNRQNGKQYKALVEMFKKIPKEKVQAAYVIAYKESLIWCTSQPSIRDTLDDYSGLIYKLTVDSLIEESRKFTAKCVDEWIYKNPTRREQMWERILEIHKKSNVVIVVEKEDVSTFLHEIEDKIPEIRWVSRQKIFEAKGTIKDIYETLKTCNRIYFRLRKENELSYSSDPHIYQYRDLEHISYLPPMRWDLFKKGRLVVKVDTHNYKEFYEKCESVIGRKPRFMRTDKSFTVYYKNGTFHERPYDEKFPYKYKVVNWEEVK